MTREFQKNRTKNGDITTGLVGEGIPTVTYLRLSRTYEVQTVTIPVGQLGYQSKDG